MIGKYPAILGAVPCKLKQGFNVSELLSIKTFGQLMIFMKNWALEFPDSLVWITSHVQEGNNNNNVLKIHSFILLFPL